MNPYIDQIEKYIMEHPIDYGYEHVHSLLELLSLCCLSCDPMDSDTAIEELQSIDQIAKSLSKKKKVRLRHLVGEMCEVHERAAFEKGVKVGAQLIMEFWT